MWYICYFDSSLVHKIDSWVSSYKIFCLTGCIFVKKKLFTLKIYYGGESRYYYGDIYKMVRYGTQAFIWLCSGIYYT